MEPQDFEISYADFYGLNVDEYIDVPVTALPFSVRVLNRFMGNGINTIADMLRSTPNQLMSIKGFGKGCLDEIEKFCKSIQHGNIQATTRQTKYITTPSIIAQNIENIAMGDFTFADNADLTTEELELVNALKCSYTILGEDLAFDCVTSPERIIPIIQMLDEFNAKMRVYLEFQELEREIPASRRKNKAEWYINAFTIDDNERNLLASFCVHSNATITSMATHANTDDIKAIALLRKFFKWCKFDLSGEINSIFGKVYFNDRAKQVISLRAEGQTLEQIGSALGVTRERVRQIEAKAKRVFAYSYSRLRIVSKIAADRNGDAVLTPDEIREYCTTDASAFLFLLRGYESANYTYDRQLDVFIVGDDSLHNRVQEYIETLPELLTDDKIKEIICSADEEADIPAEMLERAIYDAYKLTGDVYHKNRLTRAYIYEVVLREFYPEGIRAYDPDEIQNFRAHVFEKFGNVEMPTNDRALTARITSICVLCGRGIYRLKKDKYISDKLAERIYRYICESDNSIFLTNTIFSIFEEELTTEGIDNKYYLQGILHEMFADKFIFRRDYISKDTGLTSVYSSVVEFIRKAQYPMKKSQIQQAFPGITEIVVNLSVSDPEVINYFGAYLHASKLKIANDEKENLKQIVLRLISDHNAHHASEFYTEIQREYPEVLNRNAAMFPFATFSILEYLFRDNFQFSRPYIALNDVEIGRPGERLHDLIYSGDEFAVADLGDFCKENRFQIQSILEYINSCNDRFLLADANTMLSIEQIGITDQMAAEVEAIISDEICETILISHLTCWNKFPKIEIPWSEWLVYSVINKWGKTLCVGTTSNQFRMAMPIIAPAGKIDANKYKDVAKDSGSAYVQADNLDDLDTLLEDIIGDEIWEDIE